VLLVVGPSGSGKSTLARAAAGLLPEQFPGEWQGSFRVGDADVARAAAGPADDDPDAPTVPTAPAITTAGLGAGIVFQDPASQLVLERVGDDVAFGLENLAWGRAAMRERVPEALAGVGLRGVEDRRSTRLSGGEQQRVAIAGVLAPGPGLLVLDEPTAHLDTAGAEAVFRILRSIREREAATIVLVEHRIALAWPLADLVLALDDEGRPIDVGPPDVVLARSRSKLAGAGIWLPEDEAGRPAPVKAARDPMSRQVVGSAPILDVDELRFGFSPAAPVLRSIDVEVQPGERVALAGRNGSGKTTLLRLALGLLAPVAGTVRLGGRDPRRLPPTQLARLAGMVVQEPETGFLGQTVREEIELGLEPEQAAYAHDLAERLRLPLGEFGERSPYRLSGGEQRRLSLVTGLARRPLLLALDEPTFGQDRRGHEALVAALDELVGEGSALLAATHDDRFVRDATDRRIELADGWVLADEPVAPGAKPKAGP
jgi:energy-coupling factor transporter ATP-binding protein EcfA2